jgi:hypothetical protein
MPGIDVLSGGLQRNEVSVNVCDNGDPHDEIIFSVVLLSGVQGFGYRLKHRLRY